MRMKNSKIQEKLWELFPLIEESNPLVQCITNRVTINDCANALLAVGASPVMADGKDAGEMAEMADALVLNIGSLKEGDEEPLFAAAKTATRRKIPIVLDPVGAGSTPARLAFTRKLLEDYPVCIIRGNWSEIRAVATGEGGTRGVDTEKTAQPSLDLLKDWALNLKVILAVTGKEDWITDGKRWVSVQNGDARLQKITGTGCMSTSLCGATAAALKDHFWGAVMGVFLLSLAGERAGKRLESYEGSGTLRVFLIDELDLMNQEKIKLEGRVSGEIS